jgi:probable phosphoglycerate mutase
MRIYATRHGLTELNKQRRTNGQTIEDPLTHEGIEQAKKITQFLPKKLSVIYTSDLLRARQTAEIINKQLNIELINSPELREIHLGSLTGKTWDEMNHEVGRNIAKEYQSQKYDFRPWGGESIDEVKKRVLRLIKNIREHDSGKNVLLVTHGGIIRLLQFLFQDKIHDRGITNLEIHEFEI